MKEFVLWGLGVIVGFIVSQFSLILLNYYTTYKENQKTKQEFLKAQAERMKQNTKNGTPQQDK